MAFSVTQCRAPRLLPQRHHFPSLSPADGATKKDGKGKDSKKKSPGKRGRKVGERGPAGCGRGPGAAGGRPHDSRLSSQRSAPRVIPPDCTVIDSDNFKCILCWALPLRRSPQSCSP